MPAGRGTPGRRIESSAPPAAGTVPASLPGFPCRRRRPRCGRDRANRRWRSLRAGIRDCWPRRSGCRRRSRGCASRMPSRTSASTRFPLPTGTVDLFTTTRNRGRVHGRADAARGGFQITPDWLRPLGSGGVPTAMKITSLAAAAAARSVSKSMPPRACRQLEQFVQVRLVDGRLAAPQPGDLGFVGIDARDAMAQVSQAGARDRAHISCSNDCDSHGYEE